MLNSIIKNRNFGFLWMGHLISHAGDTVYMIALPWLMLDMTGSKSMTSLVTASAYLPAVLFGLTAGVIVDRYNRKWIMIYSDIVRALIVVVIPIGIVFNFLHSPTTMHALFNANTGILIHRLSNKIV